MGFLDLDECADARGGFLICRPKLCYESIVEIMKSIFEASANKEILGRIERLRADSPALWGKMNVAQMLAHCNQPLENALAKKVIPKGGNFLIRLFFKSLLYNDKPYGKGLPTAKTFIIHESKDFEQEKQKTIRLIAEAFEKGLLHDWPDHPNFGKFTPEQHGMMMYKHLDHHLRQFGA